MSSLFPMFMKLEGKRCLVVGAGKIGEPKIASLLDAGARVRVVALEASPTVQEWAQAGKITLDLRAYTGDDLEGVFLAVVATASRPLNASIYREAQLRGVLCNVVDDPAYCDFYYRSRGSPGRSSDCDFDQRAKSSIGAKDQAATGTAVRSALCQLGRGVG